MDRREALRLLGLIPSSLLFSCENNFPNTPTIITGKVSDENGDPVKGILISFWGSRRSGIKSPLTFTEQIATNEMGLYQLSAIIPDSTDSTGVAVEEINPDDPNAPFPYLAYSFSNGIASIPGTAFSVPTNKYGSTITLDFLLRKRQN